MKDFDDYIKKHLENINPSFDESAELAWERLLPHLPQQKKPTLLPLFLPKISKNFFVAISLGTLFLGSTLLLLNNNDEQNHKNNTKNTENNIIQEQKEQKNNVGDNHYNTNNLNNNLERNNKNTQNNIIQNNIIQNNITQKSGIISGIIAENYANNINDINKIQENLQVKQNQNTNDKKIDDKKITIILPQNQVFSQIKNIEENKNTKKQIFPSSILNLETFESKNIENKNTENKTAKNTSILENIFAKNIDLQPLKTILPKENFEFSKSNTIFLNSDEKENKKETAQEAEILKSRLIIDCSLPKIKNKILVKNGFYLHQSQMVAPLIEANNRNIGLGLANEIIFNDKYSIFTTLGIAQQKYNYQSSEAISNNSFFMRGNALNSFNTFITQNMLAFNIEGRIYPNFMFGKGFFGLGLPTQIIFQENRFDEGLEYWQLTQDKTRSNIFNGFTHLSFSMGASVALNSKTELQITPVFQIPLYKLYKENISGYTFGVKGVVLLR